MKPAETLDICNRCIFFYEPWILQESKGVKTDWNLQVQTLYTL